MRCNRLAEPDDDEAPRLGDYVTVSSEDAGRYLGLTGRVAYIQPPGVAQHYSGVRLRFGVDLELIGLRFFGETELTITERAAPRPPPRPDSKARKPSPPRTPSRRG